MDKLDYKIVYGGYKGIALDGFSIKSLNVLRNTLSKLPIDSKVINETYASLDNMSLDEIRSLTKKFCRDYLSIRDVYYLNHEEAKKQFDYISDSNTGEEFYGKINALLKPMSPFDLDIHLVDSILLVGKVHKPLIISPEALDTDIRKIYYEYIELGRNLNLLSVPTYAHEIVHMEVDQNIGGVEDLLNREVLSIFLEKVAALNVDSSGKVLKLSERIRLYDLIVYLKVLMLPEKLVGMDKRIDSLMYLKSTLIAEKLFDMYMSERKEKDRDKYIDDVNAIIEGKMTVEEMISKRRITIAQCQDYGLFLRHL